MARHELGALGAFAALGWHRAAAAPAAAVGRVLLFSLILLIFWQLWNATPLSEVSAPAIDAPRLFWYMVVTEWIAIGVSAPFRSVEIDIQTGQIATGLLRPLPYGLASLAEWVGETAHRLLVLGAVGVAIGIGLTGALPFGIGTALAVMLSGVLACAIFLLFQLQLGYAAAWTGWSTPLFWVWQKLLFVLGGLILPLSLYPAALRAVADATPFPSMLFAPASLVLDASPAHAVTTIGWQLGWLTVTAAATIMIDRAAAARFGVRGV